MDQAKVYLELAKKYHFWILCVAVVLVVVPCWWMGTDAIRGRTDEMKAAIDGKFSALQQLQGRPYHPNTQFVEGVRKINLDQSELIFKSWQELYEYQKRVLIWPAGLTDAERDLFQSGRFFLLKQTDDLSVDARTRYRDVLLRSEVSRLENWLQLLKPKPLPPGTPMPMGAVPMAGEPGAVQIEYDGLVLWPGFNNIFMQYPWLTSNRPPTMLQVKFCQEDIWVYSALFEVINKTNEGVDNWRKAWVKHIISLEIGQQVPGSARPIMASLRTNQPAQPGQEGMGGDTGVPTEMQGNPAEGGMPGAGPAGALSGDQLLQERRYVDQNGKPLPASADSPNPEYNLMPFRMVVGMDQRRIPKLLSACANSDLPIGVQQVQLFQQSELPPVGQTLGGMTQQSGSLGQLPGVSGVDGAKLPDPQSLYTPYDAVVEIRGVLYIFQPPDLKKLPELMEYRAQNPPAGEQPAGGTEPAAGTEPAVTGAPAAPATPVVPGEAAPAAVPGTTPGTATPTEPAAGTPAAAAPAGAPGPAAPGTNTPVPAAAPAPAGN